MTQGITNSILSSFRVCVFAIQRISVLRDNVQILFATVLG